MRFEIQVVDASPNLGPGDHHISAGASAIWYPVQKLAESGGSSVTVTATVTC